MHYTESLSTLFKYSSSSLKHGPYALLESGIPVITLIPDDIYYSKNNSVSDELKSRETFSSYTLLVCYEIGRAHV